MLNEIIKKHRKILNLTQEQVATTLGVSATAVYKWEKGLTYPDIVLLSPLARLLKVDLNTLLSFEEDLTGNEIALIANQIAKEMESEGYAFAFDSALSQINQYPHCESLILILSTILQGGLALHQIQSPNPYEKDIERLLLKVSASTNFEINQQANQSLISYYMGKNELDKAKTLIDNLPKPIVNTTLMKATFFLKKKDYNEGSRLLEEVLLVHGSETSNILLTLIETALAQEDIPQAEFLCQKLKTATHLFDSWTYNLYTGDLMIALHQKKTDESIALLEKIFQHFSNLYSFKNTSLYRHLSTKEPESNFSSLFLSHFIKQLKQDETSSFLHTNKKFQALLKKYEGLPK